MEAGLEGFFFFFYFFGGSNFIFQELDSGVVGERLSRGCGRGCRVEVVVKRFCRGFGV